MDAAEYNRYEARAIAQSLRELGVELLYRDDGSFCRARFIEQPIPYEVTDAGREALK